MANGADRSGSSATTDAFISYAREDGELVDRICRALDENGRSSWVDSERIAPSAEWMEEIESAIIRADSFLFVISAASAGSEICGREVALADKHNKKIIPMVWQEVDHAELPDAIARRHWIFIRPGDPFDEAARALIETMDTDLEWVRNHTLLLDRARRWLADRDRASLLEGGELEDAESWLRAAEMHDEQPTDEQVRFIAASRWRANLATARTHSEEARHLAGKGRLQAAAAHLLRAVELAPEGGAPVDYPASWERPNWAAEAWSRYRYIDGRRGRLRGRLAGHEGPVSCLAIDTDAGLAVSGSFDGTARLWRLDSRECVRLFSGHGGAVGAVGLSPAGEALSGAEDGLVIAWDAGEAMRRLFPKPIDPVTALAFAADGRIALGLRSGWVMVIDAAGNLLFHERCHGGSVTALSFHEDGRKLATGSGRPTIGEWVAEGTAAIWDLETGKGRTALPGTLVGRAVSVAIAPDATRAVRGLAGGGIELWDLTKLQPLRSFEQPETARSLAYSPDGSVLASGSDDGTIRLWSTEDWSETRILDGHLGPVTVVLFDATGSTLLSGSIDASIAVWELADEPELETLESSTEGFAAVAVSPTTGLAAAGGGDGNIRLWELAAGERPAILGELCEGIVSVEVSDDGRLALAGDDKGGIAIWDLSSGARLGLLTGHRAAIWDLSLSPDAGRAASASEDGSLGLWTLADRSLERMLEGHAAGVLGAAFTPDGERVVSCSADGSVRVWEIASGRQLLELRDGDSPNSGLDLSADGALALVGANDGSLRLWDLAAGELVRRIEAHSEVVAAVALSADGSRGLSGSFDKTARYWDLRTGDELAVLERHSDRVHDVALAPDGSGVTASLDGVAAFWDLTNGQPRGALVGHQKGVMSISLSADGATVVTGSLDRSVGVWDGRDLSRRWTLQVGHRGAVEALSFSATGNLLASGSRDGTARIWKTESHDQLVREPLSAPPTSLTWSPAGDSLLCGTGDRSRLVSQSVAFGAGGGRIAAAGAGSGGVVVWDFHRGPPRFLERHGGPVWAVAFTPDGRRVLSASDDASVRVWEVASGRQLRLLQGHRDRVWGLAVSRDGRRAATGSIDAQVRIWDLETATTALVIDGHEAGVGSVGFTGDGRLVTASADRTVRIWDPHTGTELGVLRGHEAPVLSLAMSADGRRAITGATDGDVRLWDLTGGKPVRRLSGHRNEVGGVAMTADGRLAVTASGDGTARVWDCDSGETRHLLSAFDIPVAPAAISPDGATVAIGYEDYAVRLWDLESGELVRILSGHRADVTALAFSGSGGRLVTGARDGRLLLWDPGEDEPLAVIGGHRGDALCAAYEADGSRALVGFEDGRIRHWDLARGEELASLRGHSAAVTGVALAESRAVSASMDGTLRLWDLDQRRTLEILDAHKGPVLTVVFSADGEALISASDDGTLAAWSARSGELWRRYGREAKGGFELPAVAASGLTMQLSIRGGDIPWALAPYPDGRRLLVGSSRGLALLRLFHGDTPSRSPRVDAGENPYREFEPLYASLGLRVARDGPEAGELVLYRAERGSG